MKAPYTRGVPRARSACLALLITLGCTEPQQPRGVLQLGVVEASTGEYVPARMEILAPDGSFVVPEAALDLTLECSFPPPPDFAAGWLRTKALENPHTGTTQFYAAKPFEVAVAAGSYRVRVYRGIEYQVDEIFVEVESGEKTSFEIHTTPFAAPWSQGWYSADDHLHITRRNAADDARIAAWMKAEDLHVANLLQMGTVDQFDVTPQRAFGPEGVVRSEGPNSFLPHLLVPGQEHPRTHFLGHTITLGAREAIDLRDSYILYETFWRAARELGGVSGYAHWGVGPAQDGLALDAPRGLVSFIEVLQFELPHYEVWYELLSLGLRIAPTAGTDFPCGPWSIPGRERFYARAEAPLTVESWLEAIRAGRTFVTNGPVLESFRVEEAEIGDELELDTPGEVRVRGEIRFDPARDHVTAVELVRAGDALPLVLEPRGMAVSFDQPVSIGRSTWVALRLSGDKVGETPFEPLDYPEAAWELGAQIADGAQGVRDLREELARARAARPSALHTAPIWITVAGTPPIAEQERARELGAAYRARLDALAARLSDDRIGNETIWDWFPYSDGVPESHLRRHREALLRAAGEARRALAAEAGADR